jgi:hypothetical protein
MEHSLGGGRGARRGGVLGEGTRTQSRECGLGECCVHSSTHRSSDTHTHARASTTQPATTHFSSDPMTTTFFIPRRCSVSSASSGPSAASSAPSVQSMPSFDFATPEEIVVPPSFSSTIRHCPFCFKNHSIARQARCFNRSGGVCANRQLLIESAMWRGGELQSAAWRHAAAFRAFRHAAAFLDTTGRKIRSLWLYFRSADLLLLCSLRP